MASNKDVIITITEIEDYMSANSTLREDYMSAAEIDYMSANSSSEIEDHNSANSTDATQSILRMVVRWLSYTDTDRWLGKMRGFLILGVTMLLTISIGALLNPPKPIHIGEDFELQDAFYESRYRKYIISASACVFSSVNIFLLLATGLPFRNRIAFVIFSTCMGRSVVSIFYMLMQGFLMVSPANTRVFVHILEYIKNHEHVPEYMIRIFEYMIFLGMYLSRWSCTRVHVQKISRDPSNV